MVDRPLPPLRLSFILPSCILNSIFRLIIISGLSLAIPSTAQSIQFQAELSPHIISLEQSATLKVTLSGETQLSKIQPPKLPMENSSIWQELSISYLGSSNQYQFVNRQIPVSMTWSYTLKPKKTGTIAIPSITIEYNGKILTTKPKLLQVISNSSGKRGISSYENPFYGGKQRIEASVDQLKPYMNQQVTYTFRYLYTARLPNDNSPKYIGPAFSHFWKKKLSPNATQTETIDGQQFRLEEIKFALFPIATGDITIEPTKLRFPSSVGLTNHQTPRTLITNPVKLKVRPLPTVGKPSNFSGVVGQYQIQATIDKESVKLNDAFTLTITVSGYGNIERHPNLELPIMEHFTLYDPELQNTTEIRQGKIYGRQIYEYVIIPIQSGIASIPSIHYPYFDPITERYKEVCTAPLSLTVIAKSADAINLKVSTNKNSSNVIKTGWREKKLIYKVLLVVFLFLITIGGYFVFRQFQYRQTHKRKRQTKTEPLQQAIQAIERAESFGELAMSIYGYVGKIHEKSALGWNPEIVKRCLVNKAIPTKLVDKLVQILHQCDLEQFATTDNQTTQHHIKTQTQQVLTQIDYFK